MPLPTSRDVARILDAATAGGYALPAVNVTSSQTLNAALQGFAEAGSDGIVQVTVGGAAYWSGSARDAHAGARGMALLAHELAASCPVGIVVHTDHCMPKELDGFLRPLLAASLERAARGESPLFHSHMFDGSTLPLEENLAIADELLAQCAEAGVVLEIEVGVVGGEEDGVGGDDVDHSRLYTTTEDLLRTAEVLGTGDRGRYLLAATFGNVHGTYAPGHVQLRPEILREGQDALAGAVPGARFQYVFHGSSGSSEAEIREAVSYGVVKMNVDTDMQYAFTRAIAGHVLDNWQGVLRVDGGLGDKKAFDPRAWGRVAEAAMAARVAQACADVGSAGRSLWGA
jgi:fructose-bisphosphate aldolase, class II